MCLDAGASTCPGVQKLVTCFSKLEPVIDGVFCQQDAEREGRKRDTLREKGFMWG